MSDIVRAKDYYANYHGQTIPHLRAVHKKARELGCKRFIFFAGDSSLDNKHWLFPDLGDKLGCDFQDRKFTGAALNGYQKILRPARMVKDVAYWLNAELSKHLTSAEVICINGAVEESALCDRSGGVLLPQDKFIRDNISEEDILIVSIGGNDIALKPSCCTIWNMALLIFGASTCCIRGAFGCANSFCGLGFPCGMGHFIHMFHKRVEDYVIRLTKNTRPKKVVICMIYYLDEKPGGSWADRVLSILGYDSNPTKLQTLIERMFEIATKRIRVPGTEVVAYPLFKVLDGKDTKDYDNRVEPSVSGGAKMGKAFYKCLYGDGKGHSKSYGTIGEEEVGEEKGDLKKTQ